jgi:hypothetical protein
MGNEIVQHGSVTYMDGLHISQPINALQELGSVINSFDTIIEIGYYMGGLTYWFFKNKKETAKVISYDITDGYRVKYESDIQFITKDCFASENEIKDFIQSSGKTLLFCDGGYKEHEFNVFSKYLKKDDVIMLHDYYDDEQPEGYNSFAESAGWIYPYESKYSNIKKSVIENNLEKFKYEEFRKVLIGSFTKK